MEPKTSKIYYYVSPLIRNIIESYGNKLVDDPVAKKLKDHGINYELITGRLYDIIDTNGILIINMSKISETTICDVDIKYAFDLLSKAFATIHVFMMSPSIEIRAFQLGTPKINYIDSDVQIENYKNITKTIYKMTFFQDCMQLMRDYKGTLALVGMFLSELGL